MDRKTISQKLIFTNFIILLISLVIFFVFILGIFRNQSLKLESDYLVTENQLYANSLINSDFKSSPMGSKTTGARYFNIWYYEKSSNNEEFDSRVNIVQRTNANIDFISDLMLESKLDDLTSTPTKVTLNNQVYLAVSSSELKEFIGNRQAQMTLVTLVPYNEILGFDTSTVALFIVLLILLSVFSGTLMYLQGKNITKPIKKLMQTTKKYANRDFSESLIVDTGDEIEDLSISIQKMVFQIKEYDKSQISLFRNLSHELKTPLTAISGYAEGIELGRFDDMKPPLKIIQDESLRIKNILEDLIFLSKIGSNSEVYTFSELNLVDLMIKSLQKVESIAILNDIDIEFVPNNPILISCDGDKIVRAFINIISNSLKYGKDLIKISITKADDNACILFEDNGDGFSRETLEMLYKPLDTTLDGNGLGLMIVKEIIGSHNGSIDISNENGAKISITLPIV